MKNILDRLKKCNLCPHNCKADRFSDKLGFCQANEKFNIASICLHKGEEPIISGEKGICNVFFAHCNMQCIYCQNYEISENNTQNFVENDLANILIKITSTLEKTENVLSFVSPSHQILQMKIIIQNLHKTGIKPIIIYNSNAYDSLQEIKDLNGIVDVYLADFKYSDDILAKKLSKVENYSSKAIASIKEMFWQKGSSLLLNDENIAFSGLIIRHLILPNYIENSLKTLKILAEEISPKVCLSLMAQYCPTPKVINNPNLNRKLSENEYRKVIDSALKLGFSNIFVQDLKSSNNYLPNFLKEEPFKD